MPARWEQKLTRERERKVYDRENSTRAFDT